MKFKLFLALSAFLSFTLLPAQSDKEQTDRPKVYVVADAHLDTQWNWDIQTTINHHVWNTLKQNLDLLKKYPHYIFNFEGGVKYSWMKEYYPEQYEQLRHYAREGRWHPAGASWDANDALVPSTESFFRNILLGQCFFREEFGRESRDIFLPDCFGFGWTLPTIAAHCGLIGFSSQKLEWRTHPFYGDRRCPFTVGIWKGIDGSKIMMTHGHFYGTTWKNRDLSKNKDLQRQADESPVGAVYHYYGTGDIGGSPTVASVKAVEKGLAGNGPLQIISATSDQMYKDFLPFEQHPELPEYDGELLMDVHGTGCYTSEAAMKLYNRQNEMLANAAENAAVAADWLGAAEYPGKLLTTAWQRFIFHQFHDDLTGTSIPKVYEFSWNDELLSLGQFSDVLRSSVSAIAGQMDTRGGKIPVVIANANAFPVRNVVELRVLSVQDPAGVTVYDPLGREVRAQYLDYRDGKVHLLAEVEVPASGYSVYQVRLSGQRPVCAARETRMLENSVYCMQLDEKGDVISLKDKAAGKELVQPGKAIRLALFTKNHSQDWPAWEILKETVDREPVSITEEVKMTLVEEGPLRRSLCVEKKWGNSIFRQYIRMYEGVKAPQIDFYNEIDWRATNALLKAEFPLSFGNPKATYDLGIGSVQRGNNKKTAYEVYAQQWADLTAEDGSYGLSVLNDSKYGWDKPDDHTLRLTLIHTPFVEDYYDYHSRQDQGFHTFVYSLIGHAGQLDKPAVVRAADRLNRPLTAFVTAPHPGRLGRTFSFARCDNEKVVVRTLKKAEVSDEYVVRVYETEGKSSQPASITFAADIESAFEADGTERTLGKADHAGNTLSFTVSPYGVKTFKVRLRPWTERAECNRYVNVPLPFNKKCASWNGSRGEGDFEGGNSYAAELLPERLVYGNVPFELGDRNGKNGVACQGQNIHIPEGCTRIYVLAAATDADRKVVFRAGGQEIGQTVPYYSGFIGQWGHEGHTKGFLKQDAEVAYVGTHRHCPAKDEAYVFTYLFKFALDIPQGVDSITLPQDGHVVLFSMTGAQEKIAPARTASELFRTSNRTPELSLTVMK